MQALSATENLCLIGPLLLTHPRELSPRRRLGTGRRASRRLRARSGTYARPPQQRHDRRDV